MTETIKKFKKFKKFKIKIQIKFAKKGRDEERDGGRERGGGESV